MLSQTIKRQEGQSDGSWAPEGQRPELKSSKGPRLLPAQVIPPALRDQGISQHHFTVYLHPSLHGGFLYSAHIREDGPT